jgi:uracil-DNA glycosylase
MRSIDRYYWEEQLGDWAQKLKPILTDTEYINKLFNYLKQESLRTQVYPAFDNIFNAFNYCAYKDLKIVIFGLQPTPFIAPWNSKPLSNGLAYGNHQMPMNGFQHETNKVTMCIEQEIYGGLKIDTDNSMTTLAKQGILLLNCSLTSVADKKGLHLKPWEKFVKFVIQTINKNNSGIIFCLWGEDLMQLEPLIDKKLHYVLTEKTSPTEAVRNDVDWHCTHFNDINKILKKNNNLIINW